MSEQPHHIPDEYDETEIDPYTQRKLELIEEIKQLYISNGGKIKFDVENPINDKLVSLSVEELENILFNNSLQKSMAVNRKLVERFYDASSEVLSAAMNDAMLKKDLEEDEDLKEAVELVISRRIGHLPDEAKVVVLSSNHILNSLKRKSSTMLEKIIPSSLTTKKAKKNNNNIENKNVSNKSD